MYHIIQYHIMASSFAIGSYSQSIILQFYRQFQGRLSLKGYRFNGSKYGDVECEAMPMGKFYIERNYPSTVF
jgi:hypothetical protein